MSMPEYKYTVCANLYSEEESDYIHHFDGESFNDENKAYKFWNAWWPDKTEIDKVVVDWLKVNPDDELSIQIGLWDNNTGEDIEFYSESV